MPLPALLKPITIEERLKKIFPEGTPHRTYCTREMAARTVYAMLYVGAVEGREKWLAPKQVYHLGNKQAALITDEERNKYADNSKKPGFRSRFKRWYADNSREPIRDETLRDGLVPVGAVKTKEGVPTTSPQGRFALQSEFADLFDPALSGNALEDKISEWRKHNLSRAARAKIEIVRRGGTASTSRVKVELPSGETRLMDPGPSSLITKEVVEEFAKRFLKNPAVIWISESGNKIIHRDDRLARNIGLEINAKEALPDVILAELSGEEATIVFVEVVATDGPVSEARKKQLGEIATKGGYPPERLQFITAFLDRDSDVFRRVLPRVAWGTSVWCASEPDHVIVMNGHSDGV